MYMTLVGTEFDVIAPYFTRASGKERAWKSKFPLTFVPTGEISVLAIIIIVSHKW